MSGEIPHLSVVSHTEDAEEKGRRVVLGLPEFHHVRSTHHDDSSWATTPEDAAVEAANPGRQQQDSSGGMSSPSCQALDQWHVKGNHVPTVWSHHRRQGRHHWDQQGDPTAIDDRREYGSLQSDSGRTRRTGPGARRDRRSQEITGGGTGSPEKRDRSSMPGRTGQGQKSDGCESGVRLRSIQKTKHMYERPSRRRRSDYRATRTSQSSASISVR